MKHAERLARWLAPDLARRADERDRWATAYAEAAKYDAAEDVAYREEMARVYGVLPNGPLFSRRVPKRPIDPALRATLAAGRRALQESDPAAKETSLDR